jgi:4-amino-4-deoxy-L-arabinose transferase-like glycosyltransferase
MRANIIDNPRWCRGIAVGAAVAAALSFSAVLPQKNRNIENTDYLFFYEPVARMVQDRSFFDASRPAAVRDFRYPPGFPVMLAAVYAAAEATHSSEHLVYRLFVLLCAAVAALLVFEIGCWFWSTRAALFVSMIWASYPLWLWSLKQPASETPFVPLLLASVLVLLDLFHGCKRAFAKSAALGLLYGALMLVRPIGLFLPLLGGAIMVASGGYGKTTKRFGLAALPIVVACVVIAPWEFWMQARTGRILPLSDNGAYSMYDGLTFAVNSNDFRKPMAMPRDVKGLMDRVNERYAQSATVHSLIKAMACEVADAPGAVCKLALIKACRSFYGTNSHGREKGLLLLQLLYLVPCCIGMVVFYKKRYEARGILFAVVLHVLYFWVFTMVFLSTVRYMVPVMPLLFLFLPAIVPALKRKAIGMPAAS